MKKLATVVMFLLLCGAFSFSLIGTNDVLATESVTDDLSSHIVVRGESIWKISYVLLDDALMDTSIESIDELKDSIVIINDMDSNLDDGIVTFNRKDPDYIVPGQSLIVPDLLPDPDEEENAISEPNPVSITSLPLTPEPVPVNTGNQISDAPEFPSSQIVQSVDVDFTERAGEFSGRIENLEDLDVRGVLSGSAFFAMFFAILVLYSLNMFLAYKKGLILRRF